jgi:general secretion pathway protein H
MSKVSRQGFTLLELLVVLGIAAFLLAVIPPFFPNAVDAMEMRTAARDLAAAMRQARGKAISSRASVVLAVDVEREYFELGGRTQHLVLPPEAQMSLITAQSEQANESVGAIRFYPDGSSTGGRIDLSSDDVRYVIDVSWLTGTVMVTP